MAVTVHLPKVGMTMEEGTLVRWLVPDGALVERGTTLFEMETEKVEIEVQSDGDGTLRQLVSEGMRLQPGGIVGCVLATDERDVPADVGAAVAAQWSAAAGSDADPPAGAGAAATGAPAPPPPPPPAAAAP
ncbi:MAG: biotin/lipoyl-containing protein, partial [Dehalococcoidia bacterium]